MDSVYSNLSLEKSPRWGSEMGVPMTLPHKLRVSSVSHRLGERPYLKVFIYQPAKIFQKLPHKLPETTKDYEHWIKASKTCSQTANKSYKHVQVWISFLLLFLQHPTSKTIKLSEPQTLQHKCVSLLLAQHREASLWTLNVMILPW